MSTDTGRVNLDRIPLGALAAKVGTPFYLYDGDALRARLTEATEALGEAGVQLRYAMKACSLRQVLATMRGAGLWIDAVSANEVLRARAAGFPGGFEPPVVLLTTDVFRDQAVETVRREGVLPNVGSPGMLEELARAGWKGPVGLRLNPGFGHGHVQACDTGGPSSKHGIWFEDEPAAARAAAERGLRVVLLHTHVGTGSGPEEFEANMDRLREFFLARVRSHPHLEAVNFGGGLPHPYRPGAAQLRLPSLARILGRARQELSRQAGRPIRVEIEPGRALVAASAAVITRVTDLKRTSDNEKGSGQTFVMVDAGFVDLIRPAMYGSYHHISVVGRAAGPEEMEAVVAGPLCESGDVFTRDAREFIQPRRLPRVVPGDLLAIHDAGAYGSVMSSHYNSIGRAPQVWWEGGKAHLASRRETLEDIVRPECWEPL